MTGDQHDHRPGVAEQRAVLRVNRAVLLDPGTDAAHQAAGTGTCGQCTTVAAVSFGIALAEQLTAELVAKLAPDAVLDVRVIRAAILDMIDRTERDLDTGLN